MSINFIKILGISLILLLPRPSRGQTCCTGGAPLTGSLNIQSIPKGGWGISLTYDNNSIKDLVQGPDVISNDNLFRSTKAFVTQIDYGLSNNITTTILIPYLWLNQQVTSSNVDEKSVGIGDLLLLGQFGQTIGNRNSLIIGAGIKIPTGSTQNTDLMLTTPLPPTLQPGTGSVDFFMSGQYRYSMPSRPSMVLTQTINARLNTESANFTFHQTYRFGHVIQSFTTLADQVVIGSSIHAPSLTLRYRYATKDILDGNENQNTGGHWAYVSPGWSVNITSNIITGLIAEFPVYRNLNGFQLTTRRKLIFTVQFIIPGQKEGLG